MKIMQVVYKVPQSASDWGGDNKKFFMGEEDWKVGDYFKGEFIQGNVSSILFGEEYGICIWVKFVESSNEVMAMWISPNDVSRIYYGKG